MNLQIIILSQHLIHHKLNKKSSHPAHIIANQNINLQKSEN